MRLQVTAIGKLLKISGKKRKGVKYFLIAIPFIVFITAFCYVPLAGWIYSFFTFKTGQRFFDLSHSEFVGFGNFIKLFRERNEILRVLRNTMAMSGLSLLTSPLPVICAILLNEIKSGRYKKLIQTTTTLPHFISWIIVYGLAFSMFSTNGFVNSVLKMLHLPISEVGIMGNNDTIWLFMLSLGIWKGLGWGAIIYIAAIAGIDSELYDAAKIDGANKWREIWHVTVPGVIPTYFVLLLLSLSNILSNGFDSYFVFYNSLVADRIEVLDYYVYKVGLLINDYSYSIAIGMLKSGIGILLLFSVNAFSKRIRGQSLI